MWPGACPESGAAVTRVLRQAQDERELGFDPLISPPRRLTQNGPKVRTPPAHHHTLRSCPRKARSYCESNRNSAVSLGPLGISSQPEDTAHAFVYLASDESKFMTGASIYHDGAIGLRY